MVVYNGTSNSMVVYNGTSLAKFFLKHINALSPTPKNIAPEDSQTISNDGFGKFDQSDGEKEVEQPMPVAAIPLQSVPPLTTFKRNRHTRTLVSISEEPSKTLSSPKRRKALIPDSDEDTVSYPGTGRMTRSKQASSSHEVPIAEPIIEENPDIMVDLNQIGNPEDSSDPSNPCASNVENPIDSPPTISEILLPESLETPTPQGFDKSVHAPTEISLPSVDISTPEADVQPSLEEYTMLYTHSSEDTAHIIKEKTIPSKDQFEMCCQDLAYLKPSNLELTQRLQHGISNIRSDFPYIQDLFQERGALQMIEKDMENLHSQALFTRNSYREGTLKLQALRAHEEALLKSLADIR
ncbi:hypothetical protein RHGRI_011255 [Rhododendron griersonianum]|uniref:Uncharacterized protein n=1 Tax=Rhododendron griersonianum TaxID=479676 RepID=A0AAV6KMD4_9ERIC|nr:hypothetical protein RHGRI_011255 [Rhododendron griersonianum]